MIEHRTREDHQNADNLRKKTEFYERQEQKKADKSQRRDGISVMDKETYDSLPLTRRLDKSREANRGSPWKTHWTPGDRDPREKSGKPVEFLLKSKLVKKKR